MFNINKVMGQTKSCIDKCIYKHMPKQLADKCKCVHNCGASDCYKKCDLNPNKYQNNCVRYWNTYYEMCSNKCERENFN